MNKLYFDFDVFSFSKNYLPKRLPKTKNNNILSNIRTILSARFISFLLFILIIIEEIRRNHRQLIKLIICLEKCIAIYITIILATSLQFIIIIFSLRAKLEDRTTTTTTRNNVNVAMQSLRFGQSMREVLALGEIHSIYDDWKMDIMEWLFDGY